VFGNIVQVDFKKKNACQLIPSNDNYSAAQEIIIIVKLSVG
jgi:hypothetical protein